MDVLHTLTAGTARTAEASAETQAQIRENDLRQAANQFEAIFLRNMMKEMRKVNELFDSKDNPFNSDSVRLMQGFYDDALCNQLTGKQGIGIAEMIVRELSAHNRK